MKLSRVSVVSVALTSALQLGACEVVESRDGVQCQTTQDCQGLGAAFSGTICSSGLCQSIDVPTQAVSSSACTTSDTCIFSNGGHPGRCIAGSCVDLIPTSTVTGSELCQVAGPVSDDSAHLFITVVPFGGSPAATQANAIAAQTSSSQSYGTLVNAIISQWNETASAATPRAPTFGSVVCDETDLTGVETLIKQLQPDFVLGPFAEESVKPLLAANSGVPTFAPLAAGGYFTSLTGNQWSCSPNLADAVTPFRDAVNRVATYVAAARSKTSVKVFLVQDSEEPDEAEFATDVSTGLTFNGSETTSADVFGTGDVNMGTDRIQIEVSGTGSAIALATTITTFQPDLVVMTGPIWAPTLMDQVERRWAGLNKGLTPPVYLAMRTSPALATFAQGGSTASLVNRIFSLDLDRDSELSSNYGSLQANIVNVGASEPFGAGPYNDCLFTAMYAVTAAAPTTSSITPAELSNGVDQVTHTLATSQGRGDLIIDPSAIGDVLSLLSSKQTIELVGASTYLGLSTSHVPNLAAPAPGSTVDNGHSFSIQCPVQAPLSPGWKSAGVTYDKNPYAVSGTLACD